MTKREEVLQALYNCYLDELKGNCQECPYRGFMYPQCRNEWSRDAYDLLKEQEPRVLTREEVIDLLQGSVVWCEERSESGSYLRAMISSGTGFLGDFFLGVNAHELDYKRIRFWNVRPTEEQRKAVKWDG